jgi:sarcosine oxidase subunit beta
MTNKYDAIIIGAGVIGAPIAYELSKMGYKTLSVDKNADAGEGSTAGSCAIVRAHYSTEDGVAFAYEGFKYWLDWENYLDHVEDEKGLAKYMNTGSLLIKSQGHKWQNVKKHYDAVGVQYKELTNEEILEMVPVLDLHEFWPVKRPEDPAFWEEPTQMIEGGLFCPEGGYVNDPALSAHNIMRAAEAKGATFQFNAEVVKIRAAEGKVQGITLADGTEYDAPVVVNCAGPHSFKINQMAPGVWEGCNIKTKALRHEVMYCPSPEGYDYLNDGYHQSDGDIGCYVRPEVGNMFLIGSEDPECDPKEYPVLPPRPPYPHPAGAQPAQGRGRLVRLLRRLDPGLRQIRPGRFLHGRGHQRQPVQERAGGGPHDGRVDRRLRKGPGSRQRALPVHHEVHRPQTGCGLFLPQTRNQLQLQFLRQRLN